MSREQDNTTMQLVQTVLSRTPRPRDFETALTQVGVAYRELYKLVRRADEDYWKSLGPAPVVERPKRAKPYRVEGAEALPKPRIPEAGAAEDRDAVGGSSVVVAASKHSGKRVA